MFKSLYIFCFFIISFSFAEEAKVYKAFDSSNESHKKVMGTWYLKLDDLVAGFEKSLNHPRSTKRFPGAYIETLDWVSSFALKVEGNSISGLFVNDLKLNITEIKIEGNVYSLTFSERFLPKLKFKLEDGIATILEPEDGSGVYLTFTKDKLKGKELKAQKREIISRLKKLGLKEDYFFYQGVNMQALLKKALLRDPSLSNLNNSQT